MCVADCHFPSLAQNPKFVQSAARNNFDYLVTRKITANQRLAGGDLLGGKRIKYFDHLN
jgi:hypothetical protein